MMHHKVYQIGTIILYIKNNNILINNENNYDSSDIRDTLKNQLYILKFINANSYSFWVG